MYMFINAVILALLLPAVTGQKAADGPACHAELNGHELTTRYEMPTGMVIEGPWRVVHRGGADDASRHQIMFAQLDRVVETDALTGESVVIPFPQPVRLAFEGDTQPLLLKNAAQTWCVTVMRAQHNRPQERLSPDRHGTRITALPADDDVV